MPAAVGEENLPCAVTVPNARFSGACLFPVASALAQALRIQVSAGVWVEYNNRNFRCF